MVLPDHAKLEIEERKDLLGGIVTVTSTVPVVQAATDGLSVKMVEEKITAIPYYTWCNRGSGQMQVWIPRKIQSVKLGTQ
jgi:hypothetical protein